MSQADILSWPISLIFKGKYLLFVWWIVYLLSESAISVWTPLRSGILNLSQTFHNLEEEKQKKERVFQHLRIVNGTLEIDSNKSVINVFLNWAEILSIYFPNGEFPYKQEKHPRSQRIPDKEWLQRRSKIKKIRLRV